MPVQKLARPLSRRRPDLLTRDGVFSNDRFHDGISLDFRRNRYYVKAPGRPPQEDDFTSLFTFTGDNKSMYRGSNGLLIPSVTNTPRIEYDVNGACLGILIEGARTNLCLRSQEFDNAAWVTGAVATNATVTANAAVAPDGTSTADALVEDTDNSTHIIYQRFTKAASSLTYASSIWVKANGRTTFRYNLSNNAGTNGVLATFSLTGNGAVSANSAFGTGWTAGTATITPYANGWYRITTIATTDTTTELTITGLLHNGTTSSYAGDGASGVYLWGAQLEQAAFASSYIPTTTASVARANEVITKDITGMFGGPAAYFAEIDKADNAVTTYIFTTEQDGLNYHSAYIMATTGRRVGREVIAGASAFDGGPSDNFGANVMVKSAAAFDTNDFAAVVNGGTPSTDTLGAIITSPVQFNLGRRSGGDYLFGHIRRFDFWPERKLNSFLQRITA